jgi:hypothetical protein
MKKRLFLLISIIISVSCHSITIAVAPFNVYTEGETTQLTDMEKASANFVYQYLGKERYAKQIKFVDVSGKKDVPAFIVKTENEADQLSIFLGCDYLIFGYVKKTNLYYDVELRIYSFEKKEVVGIVYDRHETNDFLFMIKELSSKTSSKIMEITKTQKEETKKPEKFYLSNYIGIYNAVGYWIPFPEYWNAMTGIVSGETGIKVVRIPVLYSYKSLFQLTIRPGFTFSYAFAMNKPEIIEDYYHSFLFKFPVDLCFKFHDETIGAYIGTGAAVQFDFIYQKPPYKDVNVKTSVAFSIPVSTGVEFYPEKKKIVGIGLDNTFDFTFYKDFFIDYRVSFFTIVKFPEKKEDKEK